MGSCSDLLRWALDEGIESAMLDEMIHDLKAREAAEINNCGLDDQLSYILSSCDGDPCAAKKLIMDYFGWEGPING